MQLETLRITATTGSEGVSLESSSSRELFGRASSRFEERSFEDAIDAYTRLIEWFPESPLVEQALYNRALAHERLEQYAAAADNYDDLVRRFPDSPDLGSALFRRAGAFRELGDWAAVVETCDALFTGKAPLEPLEEVEALALKGQAYFHLGDLELARTVSREAELLFRSGRGIPDSASPYYFAMAQFTLGEIANERMRDASLPADESIVADALERKCRLLLDAQREYTRTIKIGHPHWAAAAAYRIGDLYRGLWDDMFAAQVPADLDEEKRAIYHELMRQKLRTLLVKAVKQWERTLKMAARLELESEWVERTAAELEEVRKVMTGAKH